MKVVNAEFPKRTIRLCDFLLRELFSAMNLNYLVEGLVFYFRVTVVDKIECIVWMLLSEGENITCGVVLDIFSERFFVVRIDEDVVDVIFLLVIPVDFQGDVGSFAVKACINLKNDIVLSEGVEAVVPQVISDEVEFFSHSEGIEVFATLNR